MRNPWLASLLAVVVAGCSSDPQPVGGDDDPAAPDADEGPAPDAADPLVADPLVWTYFEIPGTRCIDGTPAGFSLNPNPDSNNVLVYLEGGGACFNSFCESIFTRGPNQPSASGIFDRDNGANPVADWNLIYVPYCSGDVYGGNAETMIAGELRQFRGYTNFQAFLSRWTATFPDAGQVLLTGSSAGGFGAAINYPQTQDAWGDTPVVLIDDSGPPLGSDVFPPCLQTIFRTVWGFDDTMLAECGADCAASDDYVADYLDHIRTRFPSMRGGLFSSLQDSTIRSFAGYGWSGGYDMCGEIPSSVSGAVYQQGLTALRERLIDEGADFGTFYRTGTGHTILRSQALFSSSAEGISPAQWISDTLAGDAAHAGP